MAFRFTVKNIPPSARYWAATFYVGGIEYWLGVARLPEEFQDFPVAGVVNRFVIGLYDASYVLIPSLGKDIYYGLSVTDGQSYEFDYSTNVFTVISTTAPVFSNLAAGIPNPQLAPGSLLECTVFFNYTGGDRVGNTAVKVSVGTLESTGFLEVVSQVKLWNLYSTQTSYEIGFSLPLPAYIPFGYYDLHIEVGTSPWSATIYSTRVYLHALTVQKPSDPVPEDFTLIRDTKYTLASTYYGYAERSTVTYNVIIPNFMMSSAKVDQMVASLEAKFAEKNARMLELKLYEKSGLVQSSYIAILTTTLPVTASEMLLSPSLFGIADAIVIAILIAVCLIVGLIIYLVVRKDVSQFLYGTPPTNGEPGTPGAIDMIGNLITMVMVMMMFEMMAPMVAQAGTPAQPKPVTEMVVKGVKEVGKGVKYAVGKGVPVVGKVVKRITEHFEEEEGVY